MVIVNKGDSSNTSKQQQQQQQTLEEASPNKDPLEESNSEQQIHHRAYHRPQPLTTVVVSGAPPFTSSSPIFVPTTSSSSPLFKSTVNPKRPRYGSSTGQWKLLPSPTSQNPKQQQTKIPEITSPQSQQQQFPPIQQIQTPPDSSSNTPSPSSKSPIPSLSAASGHDTNKPSESEDQRRQLRQGKYVSPVWKPNEMLYLARAWRVQYHGGGDGGGGGGDDPVRAVKGKTRAEKDKEVAEYLNEHGVKRDAKTAGTKWDNMLGEFRKVYEWERGGGSGNYTSEPMSSGGVGGGKSYFRLSPYERKLNRLPASFDEEVFDELSQFMGSRIRPASSPIPLLNRGTSVDATTTLALPAPPLIRDDDLSNFSARAKQVAMTSGGDPQLYFHRRNVLGFETSELDMITSNPSSSTAKDQHQLRRIGKIRMIWEESVTLWGEQNHSQLGGGRVKVLGSSFLNADDLTFFDDSMVACSLESFEDGPYKGFSVDKFLPGQQVKVFGRKKSSSPSTSSAPPGFTERFQLPLAEPSVMKSTPPWEFQDPTEYYFGCLRIPPSTLPSLFELSWHIQEPPPEEFRFPVRKDVYRDFPQGKELFFTTSMEPLDSRGIVYDILSPILRPTPSLTGATATSRDSFIGLWDDCINRVVSKFCSVEMVVIRKPSLISDTTLQDQWPNVTGFVRNFCLWRGEETDQIRDGTHPCALIIEKLLWTYNDLPYILGYYAVGYIVTFCALSRSAQDRVIRTDLYSLDLSSPTDRLKALIPCWRIAGLLPLLAYRCFMNNNTAEKPLLYNDFERINESGDNTGCMMEMTPNTSTRYFTSKTKWAQVKEIYDFLLENQIPHAESIIRSSEHDLALVFKPSRGGKTKPTSTDELIEALKHVTKALVALHDLSFMHRDLSWDKVVKTRRSEWFVCGFDEAVCAPQINPHGKRVGSERHAPEMGRGLHGVKVDVWGVGELVRTSGVGSGVMPKMMKDLQNRCLDHNPELRPTAADCYHHLLQLQSSLSASSVGGY